MTTIKTNLGNTYERARFLRFEPSSAIPKTDVQTAIEQVQGQIAVITPTAVNASPYNVLSTDTYLEVDTVGGAIQINLLPGLGRTKSLVIKDVTGHAAANPITIMPSGADTIDTLASVVIGVDFGGYRLNPRATGYYLSP